MDSLDYYNDTKYCPQCDRYVTYLRSLHDSYCTECGSAVKLFSEKDWAEFQREGQRQKRQTHRTTFGRTQELAPPGQDERRRGHGA